MDLDVFYYLECGGICEEEDILDGSNVGFALLMKCTDYTFRYFRVTYDGYSLLESVRPIYPLN